MFKILIQSGKYGLNYKVKMKYILGNSFAKYLFSSLGKEPIKSLAKIVSKKTINHDCYIYKCQFVDKPIPLDIGQHLIIVQNIKTYQGPDTEEVIRKYTPISSCSQKNYFDLLLKIYRPNSNISFPNGGKLTPYLEKLKEGDEINVEGPFGKFGYQKAGNVILGEDRLHFKRIFFIAGGSGITPCYQVIRQIANMPNQDIQLILLFANKTEQDIVLRKQLQQLRPRLKLHYILDRPPANWNESSGYITESILKSICPLDDPKTLYIHCGPFAMNSLVKGFFSKNYPNSKIFKF